MSFVYSAVKAVIERNGKILLLKQVTDGRVEWCFPGGKVDFGESPYETLIREVKEEVNLMVKIIKPIGMYWFFRPDGIQVVCTTFLCNAKGSIDTTRNPTEEKIIESIWVTKDEFLGDGYTVSHNSMKDILKQL